MGPLCFIYVIIGTESWFSTIAAGDKTSTRKLKHDVIAAIGDLIDEIDSCYEPISEQAVELIHQKYDLASCNIHH